MNVTNDKVVNFSEKKVMPDLWMNAGIYHLSCEIIKDLPIKGDIEKTTFPKYAKKGKLNNIKFEKVFWHSIDSHKDIEVCSKDILSQKFEKFISK